MQVAMATYACSAKLMSAGVRRPRAYRAACSCARPPEVESAPGEGQGVGGRVSGRVRDKVSGGDRVRDRERVTVTARVFRVRVVRVRVSTRVRGGEGAAARGAQLGGGEGVVRRQAEPVRGAQKHEQGAAEQVGAQRPPLHGAPPVRRAARGAAAHHARQVQAGALRGGVAAWGRGGVAAWRRGGGAVGAWCAWRAGPVGLG